MARIKGFSDGGGTKCQLGACTSHLLVAHDHTGGNILLRTHNGSTLIYRGCMLDFKRIVIFVLLCSFIRNCDGVGNMG